MNESATILAVDDSLELQKLLTETLTPAGYQVRLAGSGELALAEVAARPPDLILLDLLMQGMDGLEICRRLKARQEARHIPIILISGMTGEQEWAEGLKLGVADYITKPFRTEELLVRVKTHLALSRAQIALRRSNEQLQVEIGERHAVEEEMRQSLELAERSRRALLSTLEDQKRTDEALTASVTQYRRLSQEFHGLLDAIPDSLTLQDKNLKIIWANLGAVQGLGMRPEELVGRHCYEVLFKLKEPCDPCPVMESFVTGRMASQTSTGPDGRIWDARTSPLRDEHGEIVSVIMLRRDITEHRKLEAQFRHAQKMESIGRLAGGVAHDFNNMLSIIMGYGEIVMKKLSPNDPNYHDIGQMVEAGKRSAALTRQLLAFSRPLPVSPYVVNLNEFIGNSLKMLKRLVGEDVDLKFTKKDTLWEIKIDPAQIDQILANLTVNARDAIAGVGSIHIETDNAVLDEACVTIHEWLTPGDYVLVVFSDSGSGMDQEIVQKIFEPFFTTKKEGKGTGLGLSTVYGIVKQNQGYIDVSSAPGQGTTFKIYFPRHCGPAGKQEKKLLESVPGGKETLLLVEDDLTILDMCRLLLEQQGYTVLTAGLPEEALALCARYQGEIHLLLSDVVMPAMNGRQLFERISLDRPGVKVLFMSGYTPDKIKNEGVLAIGNHYIQKPFTCHDFLCKIRQVLDGIGKRQ